MFEINELIEIYSNYSKEKLIEILNNSKDYRIKVSDLVNKILFERGGVEKIKEEINKISKAEFFLAL